MVNKTKIEERIRQLEVETAKNQREHAKAEQNIRFFKDQMEMLIGQMNFKNGAISMLKEILEPEKEEAAKDADSPNTEQSR